MPYKKTISFEGKTEHTWLLKAQYDPTKTLFATVCLNTSTFNVSAMISSVSRSMSGWTSAT